MRITSFNNRRTAAFTLTEMLVSLGIGGLTLAAVASMTFYVAVSFGNISNYANLDFQSSHALDRMTSEIRQADYVTVARTNQVILSYGGVTNGLSYTWNPYLGVLVRTNGNQVETLLTGCTNLVFSYFSRIPVTNRFDQFPPDVTNAVTIKLIKVDWVCIRTNSGRGNMNTESIQSAKIIVRKA